MSEEKYNTPNSNCCGRPMNYSTEPQCNYTDACMQEYCCPELASIKEAEPGCKNKAVIPSVTVDSVEGITNLANCFVHVNDINTTFYVDDKHRIMITWAGPVDIPGYDMDTNPEGFKNQIVTDKENDIAVIYDSHGVGYTFGIEKGLDVTEAVNNKLDEMAEDGTLEGIIADYLDTRAVWAFDTVADMKAADYLVDGSYARTLGFYSLNDGGGALYKITDTGTANEMGVIAIGTTLYANLIIEPTMNVKQFGAKGDGTNDDTASIQKAIDTISTVNIPTGTFMIDGSTPITMNSGNRLLLANDAILKAIPTDATSYRIIDINDVDDVTIIGGCISGERDEHTGSTGEWGRCISIRGDSTNINIENIKLIKSWGDGLTIAGCKDVNLNDLYIDNNRRNGISVISAENLFANNITIKNTNGTDPQAGIDFEPDAATEKLINVVFNNISTENNTNYGYLISLGNLDNTSSKVSLTLNNISDTGSPTGIRIGKSETVNGFIKISNVNLMNNSNNAIRFANARHNPDFIMIVEKPVIERTVTGTGTSYASILCDGVNGNGNIIITNSDITTHSENNIHDFYLGNAESVKIIDPIKKTGNVAKGSGTGFTLKDTYWIYGIMNHTASGNIGGTENRSYSIKTAASTQDTTVTLTDNAVANFECFFANLSEHGAKYKVQLPANTYCKSLSASAAPLIVLDPFSNMVLRRIDATDFIITSYHGTISV